MPGGHRVAGDRASVVAMRGTFGTGVSQRSSSSTALGMIVGVAPRSAGGARRAAARNAKKHESESVTVSRPAMKNRKQMSRISSRVSFSPSISAVLNRVRMSSFGAFRRSSRMASK